MTERKRISWLPAIVFALSVLAFSLRRGLYATAVDEKGLLIAGHPLQVLLWTVVLAGAALILLAVRKLDGGNAYEDNFRASNFAALGHFLMGCTALLMALLHDVPMSAGLNLIWKLLGFVCAPAMLWAGFCRMKGRKPFFGVHAALCLFLLLYLVSRYQSWSGNPQLQDYVFELLAAVALILFSYHCAAFEVGMGKRRTHLALGLLAALLCGAANFRAQVPALHACGLVWALSDLCRLDPPPKEDEVDAHEAS